MSAFGLCLLMIILLTALCFVLVISLIAVYFFISSCFMQYPPPVPSSGRLKEKILENLREYLRQQKNMTVTDLGSGWGTLLLPLAKEFPQHRFIGVERAFTPYFCSKILTFRLKNLTFIRDDIFQTDISQTDIVYCFLMQKLMDDLTPFLRQNLKSGARVCSCRFTCPNWEPEKTVSLGTPYETYYVYKQD